MIDLRIMMKNWFSKIVNSLIDGNVFAKNSDGILLTNYHQQTQNNSWWFQEDR